MHCPVCGDDCITDARTLLENLPGRFAPCPDCFGLACDKRVPPPDLDPAEPCSCGRRFIDEVFAHIYKIMTEEGDLAGTEPLAGVGTPLVHPGFAMQRPPHLPERSLLLLSRSVSRRTAVRLFADVPEVRGVVGAGAGTPGIADTDVEPVTHSLLAGCDVRADVFPARTGPIVVYKQQSVMHIEFPRGHDPKIRSVERQITKARPRTFVDACSGAGTLGLIAARMGVPRVICNDAWYAAAYWTACNLQVNRESLGLDRVAVHRDYAGMKSHPVAREPIHVATAGGDHEIEVYWADLRDLPAVLPPDVDLTAIDLFDKGEAERVRLITGAWQSRVGGGVFIP
jgi:hypothetical protein